MPIVKTIYLYVFHLDKVIGTLNYFPPDWVCMQGLQLNNINIKFSTNFDKNKIKFI